MSRTCRDEPQAEELGRRNGARGGVGGGQRPGGRREEGAKEGKGEESMGEAERGSGGRECVGPKWRD